MKRDRWAGVCEAEEDLDDAWTTPLTDVEWETIEAMTGFTFDKIQEINRKLLEGHDEMARLAGMMTLNETDLIYVFHMQDELRHMVRSLEEILGRHVEEEE